MAFILLLFSLLAFAIADILPFINNAEYQNGWFGPYPTQTFWSDPEVIAPVANVLIEQQEQTLGHYITWAAHADGITATGPQLLDAGTLSVLYQAPLYGEDTFGLTAQSCNGTDYLIWWAGTNIDGRAAGNYYIFNSSYHLVWDISAVGLEYADAHDVYMTPDCHLIFPAYQSRPFDLFEYGVFGNSWLLDSYFQEIDLATNELIFEWRASDHVDLRDSFWLPGLEGQGNENWHAWDFFHINSIQKDHLGNYLISARHTCAVYYIDGNTGSVVWTLGGQRNDFFDLDGGRATDFSWQHHARWVDCSLTSLSLFDDRSCGYFTAEESASRGIIIDLDFAVSPMTARLRSEYWAPDNIVSVRKGGMQVLEDGGVILGFGSEPAFTEYHPNGTAKWDVRFGPVMQDIDRETADNYRSYRLDWVGEPYWSPKIAAGPSLDGMPVTILNGHNMYRELANDTAYFSWNGATKLSQWLVIVADKDTQLVSTELVPKAAFETGTYIGNNGRYVRAVALDEDSQILGQTPILDMTGGQLLEDNNSTLDQRFQLFKDKWTKRHDMELVLPRLLGIMACTVVIMLVIFVSQLLTGRKGYQSLQQSFDLERSEANGRNRRRSSASSAFDPAAPLLRQDKSNQNEDGFELHQ